MARQWIAGVIILVALLAGGTPASSAQTDRDLAEMHRPFLLFDSNERWRPLNIAAFLAESRFARQHRVCETVAGACSVVHNPGDLASGRVLDVAGEIRSGKDYSTPVPGGCEQPEPVTDCDSGPRTAIYYRVTSDRGRRAIDYWWFFRFNDVPFVEWIKCRGLPICHDHEGDWEGVRVLPATDGRPLDVRYDAHGRSESYSQLAPQTFGSRPVVYIALGTHAAYPRPCESGRKLCAQTGVKLPESRFDGDASWGRNSTSECGDTCLLPLPDASWAEWPGRWGLACSRGPCQRDKGPESPGRQHHREKTCRADREQFQVIGRDKAIKWPAIHKLRPKKFCR